MSTATRPDAESAHLPRHRWTSEEFRRLVDQGILREASRAFLWDGEIIEPMARKRPHINAEKCLERLLVLLFPDDARTIDQDSTVFLRDGFEPQPDLMVLRGPRSLYHERVPTAADVVLLIEVAFTSYAFDSGPGLREYARSGIDPYWIVNLPAQRFEVYSAPIPGGESYRSRRDYPIGEAVPIGEHRIAVADVLR